MENYPPQKELFGLGLLWFFLIAFGIQLFGAAFGTALGAVTLRWRTVGSVVMMLIGALIGGLIGWSLVSLDRSETTHIGTELLMPLVCTGVFAIGIVTDLCAAGFARFLTRKSEARA